MTQGSTTCLIHYYRCFIGPFLSNSLVGPSSVSGDKKVLRQEGLGVCGEAKLKLAVVIERGVVVNIINNVDNKHALM